jgi:hypothetical protein
MERTWSGSGFAAIVSIIAEIDFLGAAAATAGRRKGVWLAGFIAMSGVGQNPNDKRVDQGCSAHIPTL